ncbi:hypothetical protein ACFY4K_22840 [Streptomyces leeuwenhoekii]|uniref:hypothetical protein n=1 Tax=Streptomyces leeuwenhoekii TaxID=1437453 RepID=UPI0036C36F00
MFDIRITCDPADEPDIVQALTAAFDCDPITYHPAGDGHRLRLYTKAFHPTPTTPLADTPATPDA